jgi:hypothetical protein
MFTKEEKELIQDAITKISAIPSENIISQEFSDGTDKCCIVGHLNRLASENPQDYSVDNCSDTVLNQNPIRHLSLKFLNGVHTHEFWVTDLATVNNGTCQSKYPQATPKERSLACLEDMLKAETVEVVEA